jgi:octaprenyl-diphosphate synthase
MEGELSAKYNVEIEKIEAALNDFFPYTKITQPFLSGIFSSRQDDQSALPEAASGAALLKPAADLFSRGGKRWRPLLMHLICKAAGGADSALPLIPLVEFCHNASLIHDDIEDCSPERRGKPAIHLLYGVDTAINSGAFLYFFPLACIDSWGAPAEKKALVYSIWGEYMRRLHLGQSIDIEWHRDRDFFPPASNYYEMCRLKTGCLSRLAARLGLLCAGKDADPALLAAACDLGLGFQILDDVKNLRGGIAGKTRADDLVEGKKSLPILMYIDSASCEAEKTARRQNVTAAFEAAGNTKNAGPGELSLAIIEEIEKAGALEIANMEGLAFLEEAKSAFANFTAVDKDAGEMLENFVGRIS